MEPFARDVLAKLPLAEAVGRGLAYVLDHDHLNQLYEEHRGGNYTKRLSFATFTHLISNALFLGKSGLSVFEAARSRNELPTTSQAVYGKLARCPVRVSMALVRSSWQRAQEVLPACHHERTLPASLQGFFGIVLDGKISKGVQHRLKILHDAAGGIIGGRSLVAYSFTQGLALDFYGDEDGDANDVQYVPELVERLLAVTPGPRLWLADAQFSFVPYLRELSQHGDHFVVRFSKAASFTPDPSRPAREGTDHEGRHYREEWGTLSGKRGRQRMLLRRITVERPGEADFMIITSLLDADQYAASDLLTLYRDRPDIEQVFQRITKVFALRELLGSTPKATLFQLALCLVLYNVLQLVRGYIASNNDKQLDEVSPQKLLEDLRDEWTAGCKVLGSEVLSEAWGTPLPPAELRQRLQELLNCWDNRWKKAPRRKQRPPKPRRRSGHACAYRVIHKNDRKCRI
jgi:hypothetical protein